MHARKHALFILKLIKELLFWFHEILEFLSQRKSALQHFFMTQNFDKRDQIAVLIMWFTEKVLEPSVFETHTPEIYKLGYDTHHIFRFRKDFVHKFSFCILQWNVEISLFLYFSVSYLL